MATHNRSAAEAQAELAKGEMQRVGKKFQASFYDTVKLQTGDLELQMFQTPIGVPGSGFTAAKTLLQTNARGAGTIPKGQQFIAHGIIPYIFAAGATINNAAMLAIQLWMRQVLFRVSFPGGADLIQERGDFVFNEQRSWVWVPTVAGDNPSVPQQLQIPGFYKLNEELKFASLDSYEIRLDNRVAVAAAMNNFEITWRFVGFLKRLSS